MPTRHYAYNLSATRNVVPALLIVAVACLAAGCDKIQIPEVGQQAAPAVAPVAPVAAPVQAPVEAPKAVTAPPPDPKAAVTAFLKKSKTEVLLDRDLVEITSAEGAEGFELVEELHLGGQGITDEGVSRLSKFSKLNKLELAGSKVTVAGLEVIKELPELQFLGLNNTQTDDRIMSTIAAHPGIKELYLASTAVTDVGLNELEKLDDLEVLDITSTGITGAGFQRFKGHKHLRSLIAQRSGLQNEALKFLVGCPIEVLEIDMSGVSDPGMIHVGKMKQLKRLSFGFSSISDAGIQKLGVMKDLEYVNARNCAMVSSLLFKKLMTCKKLTYVCVVGTRITATDCANLKKLIPACEIVK